MSEAVASRCVACCIAVCDKNRESTLNSDGTVTRMSVTNSALNLERVIRIPRECHRFKAEFDPLISTIKVPSGYEAIGR